MARYIVLSILIFLGGCTSMADLRAQKPEVNATSEQSPRAIVECVAAKWSSKAVPVSMVPIKDGYSLQVSNHDGLADLLLDVTALPHGSHVVYAERASWMQPGFFLESVRRCI